MEPLPVVDMHGFSRFRFGASLLGAAALLATSLLVVGCGRESSYCDDTGCYVCDGLGCRRADDGTTDAGGGVLPDAGSPDDAGPARCTGDSDCDRGLRCSAGECRAPDGLCQFNAECGGDRTCIDGRCLSGCDTAADCPDPSNQVCEDNVCRCGASGCNVDDSPAPFCTGDAQCQSGHPCVGGICRTPCDTHDDCLRFDVQFNYCLDGYCATTNEVTSDCALSVDCPSGKQCVDGVCG